MAHIQGQGHTGVELRRYPRHRVSAPFACAFSLLGLKRWAAVARNGLGVVLDVSLGGVKVMSTAEMRPGDHLALSLRIPDQVTALQLDARVKWIHEQIFGLEFVTVPLSAESRLKKFLTRSASPCS